MPRGNRAQQAILGSQVLLGPLEIWGPKDRKASLGAMGFQAPKARWGQLGLQGNLG